MGFALKIKKLRLAGLNLPGLRPAKFSPAKLSLSRLILAVALFSALSACSLAPEYHRPELPVPETLSVPEALSAQNPEFNAAEFKMGWRDFFTDPKLQKLIAAGLEQNKDLKIAALAVQEARARYGVQNSERLPQLDSQATGSWSGKFKNNPGTSKNFEAALMPSFELDFFGRLKSMSEAALQSYLATDEAARTVQIGLVSQVAQGYLAFCLAQESLTLAQSNLDNWRKSHEFIERRLQAGQSSLLDLEQARSMTFAASAKVAELEREKIQALHALQLLLGSFDPLALEPLEPVTPLMEHSFAELPQGISSTLLLDRPDVMRAEHMLLAANADIGAARAAFFPSISLTGSLGYMSEDLGSLVAGSNGLWSFLPKITLPIFSGGKNTANLDMAEIRKESSVIEYEKTIQTAFREVADAMLTNSYFAEQLQAQKYYLSSQRTVLNLATNRYINGSVSYLEVLDAQRGIFQAEQDLLNIRRAQLNNAIALFSALGGGIRQ